MHLSTKEPAASRMLKPFGEVGGDVPEYFSSREHILLKSRTQHVYWVRAKIEDKKVNAKN